MIGKLPDRGDDRFLPVFTMDKSQTQLDRGGIRQVAQPCLARVQFALRTVSFPHERPFDLDIAEFHPDRLIVLAPVFDVGLDYPLLVDHFLEIVL